MIIVKRSSIRERAKKVPLSVRLYVRFWMQWLTENVGPKKRGHTEDEYKKADEWAAMMVQKTLNTIDEWKKDGAPTKEYKKPIRIKK